MKRKYIHSEIITERKYNIFKSRFDQYIQHLQTNNYLFEIHFSTDALSYNVLIMVYQEVE